MHRCAAGFPVRAGSAPSRHRNARHARLRRTTTCVARGRLTIRDPGRAIRRHSRFIPDGRLAPVGLVRHACTSSFRTNPIARMERKAARSRRLDKRRSEWPGRSAIHVCNTTRCDSVCFHSLVPVSDTSDPLKRSPDRLRPRPPAEYARSAPCFTPQGRAGQNRAIDAHRAPANSANVSKLKRLPDRLPSAGRAVTPHPPGPGKQRDVASARTAERLTIAHCAA